MQAALREKEAFIERFRMQGYYAAVGRRISFEELADLVLIEPWDEDECEAEGKEGADI